jgi:hypothetical protein
MAASPQVIFRALPYTIGAFLTITPPGRLAAGGAWCYHDPVFLYQVAVKNVLI